MQYSTSSVLAALVGSAHALSLFRGPAHQVLPRQISSDDSAEPTTSVATGDASFPTNTFEAGASGTPAVGGASPSSGSVFGGFFGGGKGSFTGLPSAFPSGFPTALPSGWPTAAPSFGDFGFGGHAVSGGSFPTAGQNSARKSGPKHSGGAKHSGSAGVKPSGSGIKHTASGSPSQETSVVATPAATLEARQDSAVTLPATGLGSAPTNMPQGQDGMGPGANSRSHLGPAPTGTPRTFPSGVSGARPTSVPTDIVKRQESSAAHKSAKHSGKASHSGAARPSAAGGSHSRKSHSKSGLVTKPTNSAAPVEATSVEAVPTASLAARQETPVATQAPESSRARPSHSGGAPRPSGHFGGGERHSFGGSKPTPTGTFSGFPQQSGSPSFESSSLPSGTPPAFESGSLPTGTPAFASGSVPTEVPQESDIPSSASVSVATPTPPASLPTTFATAIRSAVPSA